jgi:hypothetical protein
MRVMGYHDPRRRIAKLMNKAQRTVNVLEHTDRVRDHDIIEWTVDIGERVRILSILEYEMKVRKARPCSPMPQPSSSTRFPGGISA